MMTVMIDHDDDNDGGGGGGGAWGCSQLERCTDWITPAATPHSHHMITLMFEFGICLVPTT